MNYVDILNVITAALATIGTAGTVIFALSSFLGKIWAERILEKDRNKYSSQIAELTSKLDIEKQIGLGTRDEKIQMYKLAIDMIAELLSAIDAYLLGNIGNEDINNIFHSFNKKRINVYGYIGMFAPQYVMDAQDGLMDYLLKSINGNEEYKWETAREKSLILLNAMRKDIGIDKHSIKYNGDL